MKSRATRTKRGLRLIARGRRRRKRSGTFDAVWPLAMTSEQGRVSVTRRTRFGRGGCARYPDRRIQGAEKRNGDTLSKISNCQSCRFRLLRGRLPWTSTGAVKPGEVKLLKIPACPPLAFSGVRPGLPSRVKLSCLRFRLANLFGPSSNTVPTATKSQASCSVAAKLMRRLLVATPWEV